MRLIIGGYAQGKLEYVKNRYAENEAAVFDGELPAEIENKEKTVIINHFHQWIKKRITLGGRPEEEIICFLNQNPDCVIISDEIGNGIIPADMPEREYRERTGRIITELAARAKEVERVICGIGQRIK